MIFLESIGRCIDYGFFKNERMGLWQKLKIYLLNIFWEFISVKCRVDMFLIFLDFFRMVNQFLLIDIDWVFIVCKLQVGYEGFIKVNMFCFLVFRKFSFGERYSKRYECRIRKDRVVLRYLGIKGIRQRYRVQQKIFLDL